MLYFVYILQSADGSYYVGQTNNLTKRLKHHNGGLVRSTKNKKPWRLMYNEEDPTKIEARNANAGLKLANAKSILKNWLERPARSAGRWSCSRNGIDPAIIEALSIRIQLALAKVAQSRSAYD
ncbi:GIY-YIG nuclease family protein [Candidatus Zixiibacteriota bacterium]